MTEQLDLFRQPAEPPKPKPDAQPVKAEEPRTQLTELPGETFEEIFAGRPSRARNAA